MQIRHILGTFCFGVAGLLLVGEALVLAITHGPRVALSAQSVLEDVAIAVAGALAGVLLFRSKVRLGTWLALFVSGFGIWKFWVWPILLGQMSLQLHPGEPPWMFLLNLAKIALPVMLTFSVIMLFQRKPDAAWGESSAANRSRPLCGWLSILCPVVGIPFAYGIMQVESLHIGEGRSLLASSIVFSYVALVFGFAFVTVAYVRWEKFSILPLIGFFLNAAPLLWFWYSFEGGTISAPILCVLFCATCTVLSLAAREKGRTWALLAAVPSVFMLAFIILPAETQSAARGINCERSTSANRSA